MTYYLQAIVLTFIEALCCKIFFDIFLKKRYQKKWINSIIFFVLLGGFVNISIIPTESYIIKAILAIIVISVVMSIQYRAKPIQILFLTIVYYGLLICIDSIMIAFVQHVIASRVENIFDDSIKVTIIALLCKTILYLCILCLNKKFEPHGSLNSITDKEWIRFLFFPIITIVCMSIFALDGGNASKAMLVAAFSLVLLNFVVFYIIRDVIAREKDIQEMCISQERIKNQMDMYQYMESVYSEQRKKTHEFKNYLSCLQGLLKTQNYLEAETYLNSINSNWIEEIDYINTNNVIVNSVVNQKFKLAKKKGILIVLSINDLGKVPITDEDLVTLLANLLDNAIEACEKVKENVKLIKLRFIYENGGTIISVRNPVVEPVEFSGETIFTTKSNKNEHGIGLINIRNVVNKYGGESICSCNEGYFTHSIIINHYLKQE